MMLVRSDLTGPIRSTLLEIFNLGKLHDIRDTKGELLPLGVRNGCLRDYKFTTEELNVGFISGNGHGR